MADEINKLRTLIPDDAAVFGASGSEYMFSDEQLGHFLEVGGGSILRATALATYAIAASEVLISKVIKTQDLATDGAKVAQALIAKADSLMAAAAAEDQTSYFEIIDYGWGGYPPELTENVWRL